MAAIRIKIERLQDVLVRFSNMIEISHYQRRLVGAQASGRLALLLVCGAAAMFASLTGLLSVTAQVPEPSKAVESATESTTGPKAGFLTGSAFQRGVSGKVSVTWRNAPLRAALRSLEKQTRTAIWLDRRIDPGQPLDFNAKEEPIRTLLGRLAATVGAESVELDSVIYIGPTDSAARLSRALKARKAEIRDLPKNAQRRIVARSTGRWNDLATPREILDSLATRFRIRIQGAESVPHDLWVGRSLPSLPLVDQLQLVLAGFDTTFRFVENGDGVVLTPLGD